jgi:(p)ppGpp synthase/HD superfamily hydrolase
VPFLYHPLAVASLVMKHGGSELQAIAALLHDTISDESVTHAEVVKRFGGEVARLVFAFEDPPLPPGTAWEHARRAYLEKLKSLDEDALLVVACEELHDVSELLLDLRYRGVDGWKRFSAPAMTVGWYYRELLAVLYKQLAADRYRAIVGELGAQVRALNALVFDGNVLPK